MNYQDAPASPDDTTSVSPNVPPSATQCHPVPPSATLSVSRKILSIFDRVFKSKPANR